MRRGCLPLLDGILAGRHQEFRPPQTSLDQIVEHCPPSLSALAAHALDRQQHLLAVGAHANDQQRDRRGFPVEPTTEASEIGQATSPFVLG
jgi:hypothetical protein